MKKHWITYHPEWTRGPMTFWVHRQSGQQNGEGIPRLDPPAPKPVPGKGWPAYFVELDGFTFQFSSLAELDVCVSALGQKVLPTTRKLSEEHGSGAGPNSHWLSRLPKGTKSWRYRQKAAVYLMQAREEFAKLTGAQAGRINHQRPGNVRRSPPLSTRQG
jgi:hypothetical protein